LDSSADLTVNTSLGFACQVKKMGKNRNVPAGIRSRKVSKKEECPFSGPDPLAVSGEEIDEEVLAEVVGGGVESPSVVDLGDLLDELDQVGVLPSMRCLG